MMNQKSSERQTFFKSDIKEVWLEKDIQVIHLAKRAWPLHHKTVSELLAAWGQDEAKLSKALGFGGTLYEVKLSGGYTGVYIAFAAYEDVVVALRMQQRGQNAGLVIQQLSEAWGEQAQIRDEEIHCEFWDPDGRARWHDAIAEALGACEVTVPTQHQPAYALLMDPLTRYDYGSYCYFAGIPPEGRQAITHLLNYQATSLIRAVLRSANPEARVYAVETLLSLEQQGISLSEADKAAIQKIVDLGIPISVCDGCFVSQSTAKEIFSPPRHVPSTVEGRKAHEGKI